MPRLAGPVLYNWKDVAAALIREGLIIEVHRHQMRRGRTIRNRPAEAGIALLISIFVLLLISVVAIALIVSSGTESALAGNYRSSTGVYYAALSGLEEARGRLLARNPMTTASVWNRSPLDSLNVPGPLYKWVRINAVSEVSLNVDADSVGGAD